MRRGCVAPGRQRIVWAIPYAGGSPHLRVFGSSGRSLTRGVRRTYASSDRLGDPLRGGFAAPTRLRIVWAIPYAGGSPHLRAKGSSGRSLTRGVRRTYASSDRLGDPLRGGFAAPPRQGIGGAIPNAGGAPNLRVFGSSGRSLTRGVRRTYAPRDRPGDPLRGGFAAPTRQGIVWAIPNAGGAPNLPAKGSAERSQTPGVRRTSPPRDRLGDPKPRGCAAPPRQGIGAGLNAPTAGSACPPRRRGPPRAGS